MESITNSGSGDNARTTYAFVTGSQPVSSAYNTATTKQVNVYDGIAKGDYVIMTKVGANFYDVQKASTVTASITALNQDANGLKSIVAGGTTYSKSGVQMNTITGVTGFGTSVKLGDGVLILDAEGSLIAVAGVQTTTNYAYVAEINKNVPGTTADGMPTTSTKAMVYFADGTKGAYDVDVTNSDVDGDGSKGETGDMNSTPAGIYNVVRTSDTEVTLAKAAVSDQNITGVTKGVSKLNTSAGAVYTDASTVVFVVSGSYSSNDLKVTVFTGTANIPTLAKAPTNAVLKAGSSPSVVDVMFFDNTTIAAEDTNVYFYNGVYALGNRVEKDKTIPTVTYTVYQNGEATTLTFDKAAAFSTDAGFVKVKADSTDLEKATSATIDSNGIAAANDKDKVTGIVDVDAFFNNTLTIKQSTNKVDFQVTADTKVVCLLDSGDVYTLDQLANDQIVTGCTAYVSYTRDANDVLTATSVFVTAVTPYVPGP